MFAVVRTGGKQYRVAPGDKIVVEKLDGNAGDRIELGDVLLAGNAGKLESTDGLKVAAEIVAQAKADKVTVFKKRRRHNYRRKKGHRQQHTILRIIAIGDHKAEKKAPVEKPAKAPVPAPAKSSPAKVEEIPTENPAPDDQKKANPPVKTAAKTAAKTPAKAKPAAETKAKPAAKAKAPSTKTAAPAKPAAKKTPKAK